MSNVLDGLQYFYEREKLVNEIEQSASENQKYNALHLSCGDVFDSYPMAVPKMYLWSQGGRITVEPQHESRHISHLTHCIHSSDDYSI